ncbi:unnamed protein product [Amoebophrya sp. A25]|nr:unnamed protein product [Amoebophrya sp. A25]|eukprot:GSA25T00007889001.1
MPRSTLSSESGQFEAKDPSVEEIGERSSSTLPSRRTGCQRTSTRPPDSGSAQHDNADALAEALYARLPRGSRSLFRMLGLETTGGNDARVTQGQTDVAVFLLGTAEREELHVHEQARQRTHPQLFGCTPGRSTGTTKTVSADNSDNPSFLLEPRSKVDTLLLNSTSTSASTCDAPSSESSKKKFVLKDRSLVVEPEAKAVPTPTACTSSFALPSSFETRLLLPQLVGKAGVRIFDGSRSIEDSNHASASRGATKETAKGPPALLEYQIVYPGAKKVLREGRMIPRTSDQDRRDEEVHGLDMKRVDLQEEQEFPDQPKQHEFEVVQTALNGLLKNATTASLGEREHNIEVDEANDSRKALEWDIDSAHLPMFYWHAGAMAMPQ